MIRTVIADDHPIVRAGLKQILSDASDTEVAAEAGDGHELLKLIRIASGKTVKEIAAELALSEKTVSTYRARILEKMNMKSNAELTHYGIKQILVD